MMDDRLPVHASPYAGRTPYTSTQSDTEYHSPIPVPHGPNTPYSGDTTNSPAPAYTSTPNASSPYTSHHQYSPSDQTSLPPKIEPHEPETLPKPKRKLSKKWQRRLYWMIPLAAIAVALLILFEVYRSDFERWVKPAADWLKARDSWSWTIPTVILIALSFPPLFGHEIVMLVVGLTYPLGVGIGIACAGAILGEAACFVVFKYFGTSYVDRKVKEKVKWAATARVSQEAGFRGVLIIRYSIVPPHLANPLFACTGMKFWLYMVTVVLSLPKTIIFVILGAPATQNTTAAKWGKVIAVGVLVIITIFASLWIRKKSAVAIKQIEAERAGAGGDEMQEMLNKPGQPGMDGMGSPPKSATYGRFETHSTDVEASPAAPTYGRLPHRDSEVDLGIAQQQGAHALTPSLSEVGAATSPGHSAYNGYGRSPRIAVTSPDHSAYGSPSNPPYPRSPASQRSPNQPQATPQIGTATYMTSPEQLQRAPTSHPHTNTSHPPYPNTPYPHDTARIPTPLKPAQGFHTPRQRSSETARTPTQQYNMYHTAKLPGSDEPGQAF